MQGGTNNQQRRAGSGLPWFWVGSAIGAVFAASSVLMITHFFSRRRRKLEADFIQDDFDLVDDLTGAMAEGLHVLAQARQLAEQQGSSSFSSADRERIRFGLGTGRTGSGTSGWYTGEDESES